MSASVKNPIAALHFHEKVTSDNSQFAGVHPLVAQDSHQKNLATLIAKALEYLPLAANPDIEVDKETGVREQAVKNHQPSAIQVFSNGRYLLKERPDFISVTRGPGLRSCLATGLDTAKGLAVAFQVPLIGVNHMQAHALTPRLASALKQRAKYEPDPAFPFLSLLVSGGHTLLVHSKSVTDHEILATTNDVAIGDCLDKTARAVLPSSVMAQSKDAMYGSLLETFAFPSGPESYNYTPPTRRHEELARKPAKWGWSLGAPLSETRAGKSREMKFTFTGTQSNVERICETRSWEAERGNEERVDLARESMRVVFEHLSSRVVMALQQFAARKTGIHTLVVSGGVARNDFLKHVLRSFLDARGFSHVRIIFPPTPLCTDNAAMIGWTGIEMFEAGWESDLSIQARRKWAIDPEAEDGGILGADGWKRRIREEGMRESCGLR